MRHQLAKEKSDLLNNRLHWTRDEAERFLKRWEQLQQAAAKQDSAGAAARKKLDNALRNLRLTLHGTQIGRGDTTADQEQNLRNAGRYAPPPEWAEQLREYMRGVAAQAKGTLILFRPGEPDTM